MAFSKKKPYYYLKDAHLTFMQRRDRWLRDLYTKESLFEKPYFSERAEMHMEMPSFVLPQFPPYPEYGPLPPINYPPPYDRYVPRTPTRFPRDPTPDERRTSLSGRTPKKSTELLSGGGLKVKVHLECSDSTLILIALSGSTHPSASMRGRLLRFG